MSDNWGLAGPREEHLARPTTLTRAGALHGLTGTGAAIVAIDDLVSEVGCANSRCCSRTACKQPPVYTLTFVYRDSTAVLGPLVRLRGAQYLRPV